MYNWWCGFDWTIQLNLNSYCINQTKPVFLRYFAQADVWILGLKQMIPPIDYNSGIVDQLRDNLLVTFVRYWTNNQ